MEPSKKRLIDAWIETQKKGNIDEILALPSLPDFCTSADKEYIKKQWMANLKAINDQDIKRLTALERLAYEFSS